MDPTIHENAAADAKAADEARAAADARKEKIKILYLNTLYRYEPISDREINAIIDSNIDFNCGKTIYEKKVVTLLDSLRKNDADHIAETERLKKLAAFKASSKASSHAKPVSASGGKSRRRRRSRHRRSRRSRYRSHRGANKKSRKGRKSRKSRKVHKSCRGYRVHHI